MRFLVIASMPTDVANLKIKDGSIGQIVQSILEEQKPEAAYFTALNGQRTALLFMDIQDSSQLPAIAEPWFLSFNAKVEAYPCMNGEDLAKGLQGIESIVQKYG